MYKIIIYIRPLSLSHCEGVTQIQGVSEQSAEKNIRTHYRGSNKRKQKIT